MLAVRLDIPSGAMQKLERSIKSSITKAVKNVGLQVYNTIVMGNMTGVKSPYFSGSYLSSWNISVGIPKASYNVPTGVPDTYPPPSPQLELGNIVYGQKVFITNTAPHARQVEEIGTPTHPGGWFVAEHAKNQVVMSYRFKMTS